jgi:Mg-chelatase subunit ChlD
MQHQFTLVAGEIRGLVAVALVTGTVACGATTDDGRASRPDSSGNAAGAGAAAASSATQGDGGNQSRGGSSSAQAGGSIGIVVGGASAVGQGGQVDSGEVCHAEAHEGQRVPVDMYFLVDSSGSMAERVQGGSKWEVVSKALVAFLNDPRNGGAGVGIGYFPNAAQGTCMAGQAGCLCIPIVNICFSNVGGSCTVADYALPAVPLALPPAVTAVISNINAHQLAGGTPTRPAVEGALQYLNQWAAQHPDRKAVLVLATDGDPTGCDPNTPQGIAALAAAALSGPHAIKTFVIGVGNSLVSLDLVAQAGGTGKAFLVDTGGDVAKSFSDALDQIRGVATTCDFSIPAQGAAGMTIDPSKVNVRYTATGASASTLVTQTFMSDPKNCTSAGGWYYDNPSAPTLIKLCDASCQSLSGGSIQVEFGCDTIVQPPR